MLKNTKLNLTGIVMKKRLLKTTTALVLLASSAFANAELLAYYNFDESSGLTAANSASSGAVHDGTLTGYGSGQQTWTNGKFGNGLGFADGGDMVLLNSGTVDLNSSWTISAWFKGLAATSNYKTLTRGNATGDHQLLTDPGNELGWHDNAGGTYFRSAGFDMATLSRTNWHHIVAVGGDGQTKFSVNGELVGVASGQSTSNVFAIGNYQFGGQRFADVIDEVAIWDEALTDIAISNLAMGSANVSGTNVSGAADVSAPGSIAALVFGLGLLGASRRKSIN
jgi:hypothetical protein